MAIERIVDLAGLRRAEAEVRRLTRTEETRGVRLLDELQELLIDSLSAVPTQPWLYKRRVPWVLAGSACRTMRAATLNLLPGYYVECASDTRLFLTQFLLAMHYSENRDASKRFVQGPKFRDAVGTVNRLAKLVGKGNPHLEYCLQNLRAALRRRHFADAKAYRHAVARSLQPATSQTSKLLNDLKKFVHRDNVPSPGDVVHLPRAGVAPHIADELEKRELQIKVDLERLHIFAHAHPGVVAASIGWPQPRLWPEYNRNEFQFCARALQRYSFLFIRFLSNLFPPVAADPELTERRQILEREIGSLWSEWDELLSGE